MEFKLKTGTPHSQRSACVIVGIFRSNQLTKAAQQLDKSSGGIITKILNRGDIQGDIGELLTLYDLPNTLCERVVLIGCGRKQDFDGSSFRKVIHNAANYLDKSAATDAVSFLTELHAHDTDLDWRLRQTVICTKNAWYSFDRTKSKKKQRRALRKITLMVPKKRDLRAGEQTVITAMATADGVSLARDLGNLPANICTPSYLASQAKELKKQYPALKLSVMDEPEMEKMGMGALLSVSHGSDQPAKLITLEYRGGGDSAKPICLIGKGITFDTGGISIKPAQAMDEMKFDMCGAASVLGTVKAIAQMRLPINLVGIVASAENMPGGRASKPGDIVTSLSGQTVEILNTDAEGRLVLCDALTYAKRFKPDVVIDIATLTGACIIALGHHPSGLLSNHEPLVKDLLKAGEKSADRVWQLPLWEDYQEQLNSNFADMANVGGRPAGTITAACFLSRFAKKYRWAHLDIAGTAWHSGKEKGATGRPVPLLTEYLLYRAKRT